LNRVGIFGGTFDPVHNGHLRLAEQVQGRLALNLIQFMPCANPVHRGPPVIAARHRLGMLQRALSDQPHWQINSVELDRAGPSYTVDSLHLIHSQHPQSSLCLLLGADAFNTFQSWQSAEVILKLAHLVVCRRPGSVFDYNIYREHQIDDPDLLLSAASGYILALDIDENPCSSTEVRRLLSGGESVEDCVPSTVFDYINQHQLYEINRE